jgi:transposase-like protein
VFWPDAPIEAASPHSFLPPHCPWAECPSHHHARPFRFRRHGAFRSRSQPCPVPRFLCLLCKRTFSRQTFATSYYLKRPELTPPIAAALVAGSAPRAIARSLGCGPTTVTRRSARLGRHCLLLHRLLIEDLPELGEPLVYDHFESFAHSQDEPCGLGTLAGHRSWFVYGLDFAPHRRTGRASTAQKKRQLRLFGHRGRQPDTYRAACRHSFAALADKLPPRRVTVYLDAHRSYPRALREEPFRTRLRLCVHPNPKRGPKGSARSAQAVARDRAMFPLDLLHALLRHSLAHHRRETIAFGRRHNALLERLFVFAAWRNLVKGRSERRVRTATPAMRLGLTEAAWSWTRVFAQRLFPWRVSAPESWRRVYAREIDTRGLAVNARHILTNAA